jgi:LysM repeat protein
MKRLLFVLFILSSLGVLPVLAAAATQTWKVRPGDTLEIIAATLEIPKEEITKQNPNILENNLQIGQKLNLPLRSHTETRSLEEELGQRHVRVGMLEKESAELEKQIASAESMLRWHSVWLWGFWIFFTILALIAGGAYWIFRQTHPRVFAEPHHRTIRDLRESQIRTRSSFPYDEEVAGRRASAWQPSLKRLSAHR